jgi:spore coat protein E
VWNHECEDHVCEITARTTCARGREKVELRELIIPEHTPDNILGVLVTNHSFSAEPKEQCAQINGQFDLHVWSSYDEGRQTSVIRRTVHYTNSVAVNSLDCGRLGKDEEARARLIRELRVRDAFITAGGDIECIISAEFACEIIGEARLWVRVCSPPESKEFSDELDDGLEELDEEAVDEDPATDR